MKKSIMTNKLFSSILIVLNMIVSLVMFLPIYNDRASLPGYDSSGNQVIINEKYPITPYSRLLGLRINWLLYFVFALFAVTLVMFVLDFIKKQTGLDKLKKIALITITILLLILLAVAAIQTSLY